LFGVLAVELGVYLTAIYGGALVGVLATAFFITGMLFVWRSFYAMRIEA
jgi:K(+)-stimulated pyrophosphate-energized sodium pump